MINCKVKTFDEEYVHRLEQNMNEFLETIDVRQIIKTEYSSSVSTEGYNTKRTFSAVIYYVGIDDIRDAKIEGVLDIK
jgi:hypothetical protein